MGWEDIGSLTTPVTWGGVLVFAGTLLWRLVTRTDDLQRENISELRRSRDEYKAERDEARERVSELEVVIREYNRRYGPLPESAVTGSISLTDIFEHLQKRSDEREG